MQNMLKNARQCYKVENETWVYVYKDIKFITLECTQLKQRKHKVILIMQGPLLMVVSPEGDPDTAGKPILTISLLLKSPLLSKQRYRNAGGVKIRSKFTHTHTLPCILVKCKTHSKVKNYLNE